MAISVRDRLILALDTHSTDSARRLVAELGDSVGFYKIGLSLIFERGFWALFDELRALGKKVFADLKFFDVPETVKAAVSQLVGSGATFATVHAQEGMVRAALEAVAPARGTANELKILAVTVLTSLDQGDVDALGFTGVSPEQLVLSRARRMLELGCDGLVSSGLEVEALRKEHPSPGALLVVPGIRPVANTDDQKRVVDVEEAFRRGADYIVVGRPIRKAIHPRRAAEEMQQRIAAVFATGAAGV